MTKTFKKDSLDTFCRLALESDLSDAQLLKYGQMVVDEIDKESKAADLIATFRAMSSTEFAQRVKRACNGNATSTDNGHTRIHRETRQVPKV
jgi:hypothetical protein